MKKRYCHLLVDKNNDKKDHYHEKGLVSFEHIVKINSVSFIYIYMYILFY